MSLVKKLNPGGSIDNETLNSALETELGTFNFKKKDEKRIREALVKLRDFSNTQGNSFSTDALAQTYTATGTGSEKLIGSPDEVKANWLTGKLKLEDDADAMSVAAAIFSNAKKGLSTPTSTSTSETPITKEKVGIGNFKDYFVNSYGTTESFQRELHRLDNDDARKAKILQSADKYVTDYLTGATTNNSFEYEDLDKVKALQEAIKSGDWEKFKENAFQFKWDPEAFLIQPNEKEIYDIEKHNAEVTKTSKDNDEFVKILMGRGIPEEAAKAIALAGFNKIVDKRTTTRGSVDITDPFNGYLASKNAFVIQNSAGKEKIINPEGELNFDGSGIDQFNQMYGVAWEHDPQTGFLKFHKNIAKLEDKGNRGRELKTTIPGFEDWLVRGWSAGIEGETPATDFLGNRDYTKYLTLHKDNKTIRAKRNAEGKYELTDGTILPNFKINGFGTNDMIIGEDAENSLQDIAALHTYVPHATYDWNSSKLFLTNTLAPGQEIGAEAASKIATHAGYLKYVIGHGSKYNLTPEEIKAVKLLLIKAQNVLAPSGAKYLKSSKKGGVLKMQIGGVSPEADAYMKKYQLGKYKNAAAEQSNGVSPSNEARNITNLVRGSSTLDKAILATNVGSLAPGFVGAGSALASTVLEAARDIDDPNKSSLEVAGNIALNLGLTAASFIGLGGLRGVVKGAQIGAKVVKELDMASDISKVAKYGNGEIKSSLTMLEKYAAKNGIDNNIASIAKFVEKNPDKAVNAALGKITAFSQALAKSPKFLPSVTIKSEKLAKTLDVTGKTVALGNMAVNLPGATSAVGKILSGDISELTLNDVNSLTSVAFGAKVGKHMGKQAIAKKYGIVPKGSTPESISADIKGKKIILTDEASLKKYNDSKSILPTKGVKDSKLEVKQAFLNEYNKTATDKITIDDLKKVNITHTKAVESLHRIRKDFDLDKNLYLQEKGIKWAKKYKMAPEQRGVKKITPEREEKFKKIINLREEKVPSRGELKNKELYREIKDWDNQKLGKKPNKIADVVLKKRLKQLKDYEARRLQIMSAAEGGILKLQNGTGSTAITQKKPLWENLKINDTDAANVAMFADTINSNRVIGNSQRRAVANSLYSLPFLDHIYMRSPKMNTPLAEKQAADVNSQAKRIANSTSDLNQGMAVRMQGMTQSNEILEKGRQADNQVLQQNQLAQTESNAKIDQYNTNILGKNRGMISEAIKNLHLINSNQKLSQSAAFSNLMRVAERNSKSNRYKTAMDEYWNLQNDPELKKISDAYIAEYGDKGLEKAKNEYLKKVELAKTQNLNYAKTFEESLEYKNWQERVKNLENQLTTAMQPLQQKSAWIQHYQPLLFKSGGTLSKADRIELDNIKTYNKRRLEETQAFYKAIMHNNEMLQKSLIKVFK